MKNEKTGEDLVSIGFIIDLDYADATTSAHDLLQQIKLHPLFKDILEGGERVAWGAKALPAGGYWAMPKLSMPGAVLVGDAARHHEPRVAEGRPLRDQVRDARRRVDLRGAQARRERPSRTTSRSSRTRSSAKTCGNSATRASRSRKACSWAGRSST